MLVRLNSSDKSICRNSIYLETIRNALEGLDILRITRMVVEVVGPLLGEELRTKDIWLAYLPISDSSLEEKEGDRRDKKVTLYIMSQLTCY